MDNQQRTIHRSAANTLTDSHAATHYLLWILFIALLVGSFVFIKQTFDKAALKSSHADAEPTAIIGSDIAATQMENIVLNKPVLATDYAFASPTPTLLVQQSSYRTSEINNNKTTTEASMKIQDHTIPSAGIIKPKMTEFLPEELKHAIKSSMLTDEQIKALSEEERKAYKRTQRDIVDTLRELAGVEEENQRLKGDLGSKMQTNENLNKEINELRKQFQ